MDAVVADNIYQQLASLYRIRNWSELEVLLPTINFDDFKESPTDALRFSILIATIYNTQGRYIGNTQLQHNALQLLHAARPQLNVVANADLLIDYYICLGDIYNVLKNYADAQDAFSAVITYCLPIQHKTGLARAKMGLSEVCIKQNKFQEAWPLALEAAQIMPSDALGYIAKSCNLQVQIDIKRRQYDNILLLAQYALNNARQVGDVEQTVVALNNLAVEAGFNSEYKMAMEYLLEAWDRSEDIGFRYHAAQVLINMATIYAQLYNYDEALHRYKVVQSDYFNVLEGNTQIITHNNIGNIYIATKQYPEALQCYQQALMLAERHDYREMIAHALAQLCRINLLLEDIPAATMFAERAQKKYDILGNIHGLQIHLLNLAQISKYHKDYATAIQWAQEGKTIAKQKKDNKIIIAANHLLSEIYREQQHFENAWYFAQKYFTAKEEDAGLQLNRQVLSVEINHAIRERQRKIEQLLKENEYQALLLKQSEQIARQNEQLQQANEELQQFAYVASHDFKEPLRMIGSFVQLIDKQLNTQLSTEQQSYFTYIREGVKRLNELLDALLRYATIGNVDSDYDNLSIENIIEIVRTNLRVLIIETNALIETHDLPTLSAPKVLLIQLFQNLINNAIKFRKKDVVPTLQIWADADADKYTFHVQDNDIGIRPQDTERIFAMFQRGFKKSEYEGAGIGLTICQKIVQKLGGKIWVTSTLGEGTTFHFTLPITYNNPASEKL